MVANEYPFAARGAFLGCLLRWSALSAFWWAAGAQAQELSTSYGGTSGSSHSSYSYQVDYRQDFTENLAASLSWINEGHLPAHKRDGYAWQGWLSLPTLDNHLVYSVGVGAYYYFDTQPLGGGAFTDVHGTAPIFSLTATYYTDSRWFARLAVNRINPAHDIQTNTASLGVGYWLGRGGRPEPKNFGDPPGADYVTVNEFTLFGGTSVENSFLDAKTLAAAAEYRHGLLPHLDGTVSYIYEGDPKVIRRSGAAVQIWPVNAFHRGRFTVGMGFGVYAGIDQKSLARVHQYHAPFLSPLVSPTFSLRLSENWLIRGVFNRVVSFDKPDSDVFLLGLGVRWR